MASSGVIVSRGYRVIKLRSLNSEVSIFSQYSTGPPPENVIKKTQQQRDWEAVTFSNLKVNKIPEPQLQDLKKGTGGRSSYNGNVVTVFGATGFVGRYIVYRLGKIGTQMIIPYRLDASRSDHLRPAGDLGQIYFTPFNLRDEDSIRRAVKYSNVVINLIGRDWETWNYSYDHVHINGCQTLARVCREMGVRKLIHFSALNCAEHPVPVVKLGGSQFLRTKWWGEQKVREEFPDAIIFRPSDIWGEEDRFLRHYGSVWRLFYRQLYMWKKAEGIIKQPVAVEDVAAAVVAAIKDPGSPGKIYQAVGPHRYSLPEFLHWLYAHLRKNHHDYGWGLRDARFNPLFLLQLTLCDKLNLTGPTTSGLHWDKFEREHITDTLNPSLCRLEDLGIPLTKLEDVVVSLVYWLRANYTFAEKPNEFPDPPNPNIVHDM